MGKILVSALDAAFLSAGAMLLVGILGRLVDTSAVPREAILLGVAGGVLVLAVSLVVFVVGSVVGVGMIAKSIGEWELERLPAMAWAVVKRAGAATLLARIFTADD